MTYFLVGIVLIAVIVAIATVQIMTNSNRVDQREKTKRAAIQLQMKKLEVFSKN